MQYNIEQSTAIPGKHVVLQGSYILYVGSELQCRWYIKRQTPLAPRAEASRHKKWYQKILGIVEQLL